MPPRPVLLFRLIPASLIVGAAVLVIVAALKRVNKAVPFDAHVLLGAAASVVTVLAAHVSYVLYVKWFERRAVTELSARGALAELGMGILIGAGLCTLVVAAIWALGSYRATGVNRPTVVIPAIGTAFVAGYVEEILMRGIAFRIVEEALGIWWAFLLSAAIFGLLHARSPHATVTSTLAIASSAGLVLGAAYVLTRRLWLPIGLHFAWNFAQGGLFGVTVSGRPAHGLLQGELTGAELVSGGRFGIEASVVVVVVGLALTAAFLLLASRNGNLVLPVWQHTASLSQPLP